MFEKGKFYWWKHSHEGSYFIHEWDCPVIISHSDESFVRFRFLNDFDETSWDLESLKEENIYMNVQKKRCGNILRIEKEKSKIKPMKK
jgi:hypothetical protein